MAHIRYEQQQTKISNEQGLEVLGWNGVAGTEGLNPKSLLEASVALCMTLNVRHVLERDGIDFELDTIQATATASKEQGITNRFTTIAVTLTLPAHLEANYRAKLVKMAERSCTIGNTLAASATITVNEA